ncbi:nuclear division RFT1-like protein [Ostreococcus tauri]|uniref:Protein RFT1 homolog n=1 Tax=Ostreococcus tauri TaxID=70448 RepID=A0A1Y5IID5_OSTTA|nr:nuclear division RFT1-like protein [Ostreococcus tauri]
MAPARVTRSKSSAAAKKSSPSFAIGFAYLLATQLTSKLLPFFINTLVARRLTPEEFGVPTVHFYLLSTVILTTREGFRRALMRDSVEESSLGYAWLVLPVGGFLSIAVPFAVVWSQNISTSTPYGQALLYYGVAAFIELCAEPHYIRAMRMSAFKLRLSAETTSTVLRSFLTYALVSYNQDVVLAFAFPSSARATDDDFPAQLAYAISMAVIYLNAAPNASERETGKDEATVKLIGIFSLQVSTFSRQHRPHLIVVQPQAVWKLILAEGEKAALIAVAAADEVGVYGLVASLGAAFARLVLQPFEEAAFVIFTRNVSSKTRSAKEKDVFNALLRVAIIFGSTAALMGPHFSWLALRILYGERWANQHFASETLGFYAILLLPLAVSDSSCITHARPSCEHVRVMNDYFVVPTFEFIIYFQ